MLTFRKNIEGLFLCEDYPGCGAYTNHNQASRAETALLHLLAPLSCFPALRTRRPCPGPPPGRKNCWRGFGGSPPYASWVAAPESRGILDTLEFFLPSPWCRTRRRRGYKVGLLTPTQKDICCTPSQSQPPNYFSTRPCAHSCPWDPQILGPASHRWGSGSWCPLVSFGTKEYFNPPHLQRSCYYFSAISCLRPQWSQVDSLDLTLMDYHYFTSLHLTYLAQEMKQFHYYSALHFHPHHHSFPPPRPPTAPRPQPTQLTPHSLHSHSQAPHWTCPQLPHPCCYFKGSGNDLFYGLPPYLYCQNCLIFGRLYSLSAWRLCSFA